MPTATSKIRRLEDPKGETKKTALLDVRLPGPRFARLNEALVWKPKHLEIKWCLGFQISVSF